jgi:hypothetical protein
MIPELIQQNFETLKLAFSRGDMALVMATDRPDGHAIDRRQPDRSKR